MRANGLSTSARIPGTRRGADELSKSARQDIRTLRRQQEYTKALELERTIGLLPNAYKQQAMATIEALYMHRANLNELIAQGGTL